MMTLGCGEVTLDRVPSGQMIAHPTANPPAVVAAHIDSVAGAGLRHRRPAAARANRRYQNRKHQHPMMVMLPPGD
jgi:hypothetical protein